MFTVVKEQQASFTRERAFDNRQCRNIALGPCAQRRGDGLRDVCRVG